MPYLNYLYRVNYWVFTIALGLFQFGYSMSIMNQFILTLYDYFKPHEIGQDAFNIVLTVAVPFGAFIGSILGGFLVKIGRRKALIFINILLLISVPLMITIKSFILLIVWRAFYGICTGLFSTVWNIFVREITPNANAGFTGGINQFMITFGIMIASIFGVIVGKQANELSYGIVWRFLMGFPVFVSIAQVALLLFIFKSESPLYYKVHMKKKDEIDAFRLIYKNPDLAFKYLSNEDSLSMSFSTIEPKHKMQILNGPDNFSDLLRPPFKYAFFVGWFFMNFTTTDWNKCCNILLIIYI